MTTRTVSDSPSAPTNVAQADCQLCGPNRRSASARRISRSAVVLPMGRSPVRISGTLYTMAGVAPTGKPDSEQFGEMMRAAYPLFLLACGSLCAAEPTADERKTALDTLTREATRRAKLATVEKEWAASLAKKKDAALAEKLKVLRAEMKEWKFDGPEDFAEPLTLGAAGEVGRLPHKRIRVNTVLDKQTALVGTRTNKPLRLGERDDEIDVLLYGVDTSKWADDLAVDAPPGIWITTTEKRGGKTYLRLSRLELTKEESAALLKAAKP